MLVDLRQPKLQKRSPCNWIKTKEKKKKSGHVLYPWEGAVKEERFPYLGKPFLSWRGQPTERELQRLRGTHSRWSVASRTQRALHRQLIPPLYPSKTHIHCVCRGQVLKPGLQRKPWEGWRRLHGDSLEGLNQRAYTEEAWAQHRSKVAHERMVCPARTTPFSVCLTAVVLLLEVLVVCECHFWKWRCAWNPSWFLELHDLGSRVEICAFSLFRGIRFHMLHSMTREKKKKKLFMANRVLDSGTEAGITTLTTSVQHTS